MKTFWNTCDVFLDRPQRNSLLWSQTSAGCFACAFTVLWNVLMNRCLELLHKVTPSGRELYRVSSCTGALAGSWLGHSLQDEPSSERCQRGRLLRQQKKKTCLAWNMRYSANRHRNKICGFIALYLLYSKNILSACKTWLHLRTRTFCLSCCFV